MKCLKLLSHIKESIMETFWSTVILEFVSNKLITNVMAPYIYQKKKIQNKTKNNNKKPCSHLTAWTLDSKFLLAF